MLFEGAKGRCPAYDLQYPNVHWEAKRAEAMIDVMGKQELQAKGAVLSKYGFTGLRYSFSSSKLAHHQSIVSLLPMISKEVQLDLSC